MSRLPTRRPAAAPRRLLAAVAGVAFGLLAFEGVLQVVSFALWSTGGREVRAAARAGEAVVLCVGDSNTYGVGASAAHLTYPARLEAELGREHQPWRVVNGGQPGQNSRAVLLALPRQLASHRPDFVCILVGTNDAWSLPAPVRPEEVVEAADSFPWRWRTGRMLALVRRWLGGGEPRGATPPAFVGTWHQADTGAEVSIEADGRFLLNGCELWWSADGERTWITLPDGARRAVELLVADDVLQLRGAGLAAQEYRRGPLPAAARRRGEALVGPQPAAPKSPAEAAAVFAAACRAIAEAPLDARTWRQLQGLDLDAAQWRQLEQLLEQALAKTTDPRAAAALLRGRCLVPGRPAGARLRWALRAAALDGMDGAVVGLLPQLGVSAEEYARAVQEVSDDEAVRARLAPLHARSRDRAAGYAAVVEEHLRQMVARCRAAGATPVLLDYPFGVDEVGAVVRRLSRELDAPAVAVGAAFAEALRTRPYDELFHRDGHCTDAGYEILAGVVAARLRALAGGAR